MRHENLAVVAMNESASLTTYLLDNVAEIDIHRKRPLVVICPGGGYAFTSQREAESIAIQCNARGLHAAILRYSVAPALFPTALAQLATAVAMVRENAALWQVDTNNISVLGFSAGGHLAASLGVFWNTALLREALPNLTAAQVRPNRMVLCYPVITGLAFAHEGSFRNLLGDAYEEVTKRQGLSLETQVNQDTPPTFIWHTAQDTDVPPQNSLLFASALLSNNIPCELHVYPKGCHGLSLANQETCGPAQEFLIVPSCQNWIDMAGRFLWMALSDEH